MSGFGAGHESVSGVLWVMAGAIALGQHPVDHQHVVIPTVGKGEPLLTVATSEAEHDTFAATDM